MQPNTYSIGIARQQLARAERREAEAAFVWSAFATLAPMLGLAARVSLRHGWTVAAAYCGCGIVIDLAIVFYAACELRSASSAVRSARRSLEREEAMAGRVGGA